MPLDGSNHLYYEVQNIRVTYVPASDRRPEADWAGADVLRIQAYRGDQDASLHRGAEIPIRSAQEFGEFVAALCRTYIEGTP